VIHNCRPLVSQPRDGRIFALAAVWLCFRDGDNTAEVSTDFTY
jgi:hypothetical protein